jgi:hypothetical protein
MILVKASKDSEEGVMPPESMFKVMADYHEELSRAGVLLDANGLQPTSKGWRIEWSGDTKTVTDGPFTEVKELVAGYTIIQVKSVEEAREWASRYPNPGLKDGAIEVRRIYELEDFGDLPVLERFRAIEGNG